MCADSAVTGRRRGDRGGGGGTGGEQVGIVITVLAVSMNKITCKEEMNQVTVRENSLCKVIQCARACGMRCVCVCVCVCRLPFPDYAMSALKYIQ